MSNAASERSTTSPPARPAAALRLVPGGARPGRREAAALALILVVGFIVVLDFSIVNVALASIQRELHAGTSAAQWVITAYAVTFGGLLVLGGRIGDLFGRRRMFVTGLVLFSVASLAGGLATSIGVLVAARALQGIGAALVAPAALSLLTTATPEGAARNRALGYYGAVASIGFVAGLVLGGVLVEYFDWRSVLWVNVPIGLLAAGMAPALLTDASPRTARARLDLGGAVLVTVTIAALVYAVSEGPIIGWASSTTLAAAASAFLFGAAFVCVELRHPAPLVRLGMLRRRELRSANLAMVLIGAWTAGQLLTVPLFFQLALHYSPLATGLAMAPQGIVGFLAASRGANAVRRVGVRNLLIVSTGSAAAGLSLLGLSFGWRAYALFLPGFVLAGLGTAASGFGATVAATRGVDDAEQGLASGLVTMSRQVGAAVGVALTAAIIGTGAGSGGAPGPDRMSLLVMAGFGVAAAALAGRGITARVVTRPAVDGVAQGELETPGPTGGAPLSGPRHAVGARRRNRSAVHLYRAALCRVHRRRRHWGCPTPDDGPIAGGGHAAPPPARIL